MRRASNAKTKRPTHTESASRSTFNSDQSPLIQAATNATPIAINITPVISIFSLLSSVVIRRVVSDAS